MKLFSPAPIDGAAGESSSLLPNLLFLASTAFPSHICQLAAFKSYFLLFFYTSFNSTKVGEHLSDLRKTSKTKDMMNTVDF